MKKIVKYCYLFLLFFILLRSFHAWFTWDLDNWVFAIYIIITVLFVTLYKKELSFNRVFFQIVIYIFAVYSLGFAKNFAGVIGIFCGLVPIVVFLATNSEFKKTALDFITKGLVYILVPSLTLFLLSFLIELPNLGQIEHSSWEMYVYTNYVFFIKGQFYDIRFNSIFLEPGHLGMILSFFLYAYRFDLSRWEVWVMLIVELFTLSLAGYILVALAYVFTLISLNKSFIKFIFSVSLVLGSIYVGATVYEDGNNLLNVLIVSRLKFDDEKGIAGNNRFSTSADDQFEEVALSGEIWWGLPEHRLDDENLGAGWKVFILRYGIISMILFALFYWWVANNSKVNKKYNMLFLTLLVAAFIQRSYPWWESWIIPYCCGLSYYQSSIDKVKTRKKLKPATGVLRY